MPYYVYLMTNSRHTVLYTGVTNNLLRRVHEHRSHAVGGFTATYKIDQLVYFDETSDVYAAIAREKQVKGWSRAKKEALIATVNPNWNDLSKAWFTDGRDSSRCSE